MRLEKKETLIGTIIFIIIFSNFLCFFSFLVFNMIFDKGLEVAASILSLAVSFMIIPFYLIKKEYNATLTEIGIERIKLIDCILVIVVVILSSVLLYLKKDIVQFVEVSIQQISVSIAEEFLMRGVIIFLLSFLLQKKHWIIIVDAIIFGFFLHTGGDFISNLTYRFPAGIVLATLTLRTGRLYPAIMVHFTYNLWCIYF